MSAPETQQPFELLVSGGQLAAPGGLVRADIGCRDGRIVAIGDLATSPQGRGARHALDARGLWVMPGVIDTQVHFREPGMEHKEDLGTGSAAAVLGGVTTFFEMPNTKPATTTAEALADKLTRAQGRSWADHAFFVGASAENAQHLHVLEQLPGCAGVKVFMGSSTGSLLVQDDVVLRQVLENGIRRVAIHAEDEPRLLERRHLVQGPDATPALHPVWRDVETALRATRRAIALAVQTGRKIHVLHVTTADELPLLAQHRDLVTVETTPQHLTLAAPDCYRELGTRAQMNPPIRGVQHRAALWDAVRSGLVDVLGSDHAPHTLAEKAQPYPNSPSGMPGVQTLLPVMLEHLHRGNLSLDRLLELLCSGPARIYGIVGKGRLEVGLDADLCVVDPHAQWSLRDEEMASRVGWTPFDGLPIHGRPVATFVRGVQVMRNGELVGLPSGRPVRFAP